MPRIELRQLRQFVVVAEELHFRRAAERLNMAQPPLSQAIRKLEAELGVRLLERSTRGVGLTEAGAVFLDEARRTLAQAERAVAAARRAGKGLVGSLRVTFVGTAGNEFLPRLLREFRGRYPDVELELSEATTMRQARALLAEQADLGFLRPPLFDAEPLAVETVLREAVIAALPEWHRLAGAPRLRLGDLAEEAFIMFPQREGPSFHARLIAACNAAGFVPRVAQEAIQMETIVSLVAAGLGVALVPESLRRLSRAGVAYKDLADGAALAVDLAMAWRREDRSPVLHAFLAAARELGRAA